MTIIPLQIIELEGDGFHPLVEVIIFGQPHLLVLDTGASKTAFDKAMLEEVSRDTLLLHSEKLTTGLGTNTMASFTTTIFDIKIGGFHIPEIEVAVLDLSTINIAYSQLNKPNVMGVLGSDILVKYKAVIDYGNSTLTLNG